ncbi:MAG: PQQ-binding-like beta-propeller repeat protein [Verrucomicrobia bacterium]|nr:PQQ-binding-like beta-propeller repeat protein [Verrucomicrobiota bacterium]
MKRIAAPASTPGRLRLCLGLALAFAIPVSSNAAAAEVSPTTASLIAAPEVGWPQFRGPRRDGISDERGLLQSWPEGGPRMLWSATGAGRGYSSPIVAGGRLYITGDFGEELRILAFDLQGKPLWHATNGSSWLNQHLGARASVTYSAERIFHQNAHGRVACFDAASGKELWSVDLLARFRGENITWGLSECLLVDERAVFATAGGRDALLVALDKRTGEVLWRSEALIDPEDNASPQNAGYASPILVRFAGRRLLIGCSSRHLYCADADSGKIQWTQRRPTSYSVLAMMPVLVGDAVFMSAPLGPPGRLYRLLAPALPGGTVGVEETWTTDLDTAQGGVVHVAGRLFGSYYPSRRGWAALDATTGKVVYEAPDLVKGAALHADKRLYALSEDGWMLLLHPAAAQFEVKGRFRLATARDRDAWAHPVIHDGRLYLRYHDNVQCHDIRATP